MAWKIDQAARTATHPAGWVFAFEPATDAPGAWDGRCIAQPDPITRAHLRAAARIAREAGDAWIAAQPSQKAP